MSDTPRTDLLFKHLIDEGCDFTRPANVMVRHAETLERELAEQSRALSEAVTRGDAYKDAAECRHRERDEWEEKYATLESRCYEGFPSASDGIFDALGESDAQVNDLKHELLEVREYAEKCREALEFYANPETYHGMAWRFDRPTGGFDQDIQYDHEHPNYNDPMPGSRARAALAALSKNTNADSNAAPAVGTHVEPEPNGSKRPSPAEKGGGIDRGACGDELRPGGAQCGARAASVEADRREVAEGAGAIPARTEGNGVFTDSQRMDWLETRRVIVNSPMRYGSASVFSAQATQHDAEADVDSPLRAFIDQELRAAKAVPSQLPQSPKPRNPRLFNEDGTKKRPPGPPDPPRPPWHDPKG